MDVLNEKEITRDIVNPALDRIHTETIPALSKALGEVLEPFIQRCEDLIDRIDGASINLGGKPRERIAELEETVRKLQAELGR